MRRRVVWSGGALGKGVPGELHATTGVFTAQIFIGYPPSEVLKVTHR